MFSAFVDGSTLRLLFDLYRCLPPTLSPLVCSSAVSIGLGMTTCVDNFETLGDFATVRELAKSEGGVLESEHLLGCLTFVFFFVHRKLLVL